MTRVEQERLVGNDLRGEMSAVEEQEFFIQVALDSDLRQTLKAFRVVDTAIQKHREAISPNHAESYHRLMAMLGTSATEPAALIGTATSGMVQQGLSAIGARVFTWTTALVATGALTVGALVLGPVLNKDKNAADRVEQLPQTQTISTPAAGLTANPAQLLPNNDGTNRALQPRVEEATTGSPRSTAQITPAEVQAAQKSPAPVDPGTTITNAKKKHEETSSTFFSTLSELSDGQSNNTQAAPAKKSKTTLNIFTEPTEQKSDTIKIPVRFDKNGLDQR